MSEWRLSEIANYLSFVYNNQSPLNDAIFGNFNYNLVQEDEEFDWKDIL